MRGVWLGLICVIAVGCGGSSPTTPTPLTGTTTPAPPTPTAPLAPTALTLISQNADIGENEFEIAWSGSGDQYELSIGTATGLSDVLATDVPTPRYSWTARASGQRTYFARVTAKNNVGASPPSSELRLVFVDLRDVIDALLFTSGPMSETKRAGVPTIQWTPWPDRSNVRILMSVELADITRQRAQRFIDHWASLTGNGVAGVVTITDDRMRDLTYQQVPVNTVAVRMVPDNHCTCNTGGPPSTYGGRTNPGKSITTLNTPDSSGITHELGHAYGMWHVYLPGGTKLTRPVMGPAGAGEHLEFSDLELRAITRMRSAGMRNGSTRATALARGLVNP